jgi:hypothetical protein
VGSFYGRCPVVKLGAEVSDLSEAMRMVLEVGTTAIVDRLEQMIVKGLADGSVSVEASPRETAEALYDAWLGASVMAKIHRSPDYLDRVMATMCTAVVAFRACSTYERYSSTSTGFSRSRGNPCLAPSTLWR